MPEREIKPGISLAGAIDLEGLKHQVKAEPGQAGGAPAAGGYVIDVTQNNFQAVAQASATYPIVIFMWVPTDNRLFDMARELGDAVNGMDGKLQLARIDVSREPEIAQAFGVQGAPALFALIGGRPMPMRTRYQSRVPSLSQMERSPLWPACPPPNFTRIVPGSMSSSSWMTMR